MRFLFFIILYFTLCFCLNCTADNLSQTGTSKIVHISFIESPVISAWTNNIHSCSLKPGKQLFKSKAGKHFNAADWFNDKRKLKEFYISRNYNNVIISSRIERINNKVILFTDVYPGEKLFVNDIKIIGASDKIKSLLHCEPRNLWLFRSGKYSLDKIKKDEKNIRNLFINSGYLDAEIEISVTNVSPERVNIIVNVVSGPRYKLGDIIWNQQLLSSNDFAELKGEIIFPDNTVYTPNIDNTIREKIYNFCVKISPQKPELSIMPLISPKSEPCNPIVDEIIILRK